MSLPKGAGGFGFRLLRFSKRVGGFGLRWLLFSKGTGGFVFRLLLFFGLLVWPWPGVREAYTVFYRGGANAVFGSLSSEFTIWFRPPRYGNKSDDKDVELAIRRKGSQNVRSTPIDSRLTGYLPTAEIIALILATPIPWSRRWKALVWGLMWVNAFIALRLATTLIYSLTSQPPYIAGATQLISDVTYSVYEVAMRSPTTSFVVPILLWVLATFRRSDWAALMGKPGGEPASPPPAKQRSKSRSGHPTRQRRK